MQDIHLIVGARRTSLFRLFDTIVGLIQKLKSLYDTNLRFAQEHSKKLYVASQYLVQLRITQIVRVMQRMRENLMHTLHYKKHQEEALLALLSGAGVGLVL